MTRHYPVDDDLCLKRVELIDAERLFAVINANRAVILPWMRWVNEVTGVEVMRSMIGDWLKQTAETGCVTLGIELNGELVGAVFHIRPDKQNEVVEVGYWLAEAARGKGVATRAVGKMLDITFNELGFNRATFRIAPGNKPSLALVKRLGVTREGVSRQAWKVGDEYWDAVEFGVLASEWKGGGA